MHSLLRADYPKELANLAKTLHSAACPSSLLYLFNDLVEGRDACLEFFWSCFLCGRIKSRRESTKK